jgi:hypothetical protein
MLLCECGELVGKEKFHDYIKTSVSPSTSTIGHENCGLLFNFVDGKSPRKFSSKKELKKTAMAYAGNRGLSPRLTQRLLLAVDRLKRSGNMTDYDVLSRAIKSLK